MGNRRRTRAMTNVMHVEDTMRTGVKESGTFRAEFGAAARTDNCSGIG